MELMQRMGIDVSSSQASIPRTPRNIQDAKQSLQRLITMQKKDEKLVNDMFMYQQKINFEMDRLQKEQQKLNKQQRDLSMEMTKIYDRYYSKMQIMNFEKMGLIENLIRKQEI